jgi:hypothetical protein
MLMASREATAKGDRGVLGVVGNSVDGLLACAIKIIRKYERKISSRSRSRSRSILDEAQREDYLTIMRDKIHNTSD